MTSANENHPQEHSTMLRDPQQLSADARAWVASAEGKAALQQAIERANRSIAELREAEEPDPALLAEAATL